MGYLAAPVTFTTTFLLAVASIGAVFATASASASAPTRRSARFPFALGWALYAGAQIASGMALRGDERWGLPTIRIIALALVAAGLVAAWAKLKGLSRIVLALGLLVVSEVITGVAGAEAGAAPWFLAQAAAIAGGVVLTIWLSGAFDVSIQFRFVTAFVALLMIVIVLISSAMTQVFAANIRADALERAQLEAESLHRNLDAGYKEATAQAGIMAQLPAVSVAVAGRDPGLARVAEGFQSPTGPFESSDFVSFFAPGGGLLAISAKGSDGEATLDALDIASLPGTSVVQSALAGAASQAAGGVDVVGEKLVLIGAAPIYEGSPKSLAGAVAVGRVLNTAYLEQLRADSSEEVSLVTADNVVASTIKPVPGLTALAPEGTLGRLFSAKGAFGLEGQLGGVEYFNGFMPLERADHRGALGALVVHQPSEVAVLVQRNVGTRLFLLALAATLVAVLLSYVFGARIARPIVRLTQAAERVRLGDLSTRVEAQGSGEVGVLGSAFNQMTEAIGRLTTAFRDAAEEEFRMRSRLETILQSMTDGVIAVDMDGTIVAFNREAERMVGVRADQAIGRKAENVLVVEDPSGARIPSPFDGMRRDSIRGVIASLKGPGSAGETKTPVAITSATVSDELGNTMGLVAVVRDLTPEIEVERMKTEFLSNVSHELRTPLTPIKGYANLMIRREVPRPQAVGFLERIVDSTDRLERIVGMLVDFSAMEAGRLRPKAVPMSLRSIVDQLITKWEGVSPKHRFERKGFEALPLLQLDQRLVPRAIDELIDNAVKFSPEGGRVLISAALDRKGAPAGSRLVRITVSDEGIGIAQDRLAGLAGGFVQVDASETREYGGLGLGLAYVRRIAESHGGHLEEPRSMPGKGSSFTIVLPAGRIEPLHTLPPPIAALASPEATDSPAPAAPASPTEPATPQPRADERLAAETAPLPLVTPPAAPELQPVRKAEAPVRKPEPVQKVEAVPVRKPESTQKAEAQARAVHPVQKAEAPVRKPEPVQKADAPVRKPEPAQRAEAPVRAAEPVRKPQPPRSKLQPAAGPAHAAAANGAPKAPAVRRVVSSVDNGAKTVTSPVEPKRGAPAKAAARVRAGRPKKVEIIVVPWDPSDEEEPVQHPPKQGRSE